MTKILIAEDDTQLATVYKLIVSGMGHDCHIVDDGSDIFETARNLRPSLAIIDVMLPNVSGDEAITEVRKTTWGKNLPVIFFTNISNPQQNEKLIALKPIKILTKIEVTPETLTQIITQTLEKANG